MSVHVVVRPRSSRNHTATLPLDLSASQTLLALKEEIASAWHLAPNRQRLTLEGSKQPLDDDEKTLKEMGLSGKATVLVKDLGPQVGWRTVYLVEYIGPLFIHPLYYYGGQRIYRFLMQLAPKFLGLVDERNFAHSKAQSLAFTLIMLHFIKRELEVVFVHRFSKATMPFWRIGLNSLYYWGLSGLVLAQALYGPWASARAVKGTLQDNDLYLNICLAVWIFGELSNAYSHLQLRNLRPHGTKKRAIPYGYGFNYVSCPNYFFEMVSWFAVCAITQSLFCVIFTSVGFFMVTKWGAQRHRKYKREFGKEYPRRKIIVPFLL